MEPVNPLRNKAFLIDSVIYLSLIVLPFLFIGILPEVVAGKTFIFGFLISLLYIVFRDGFNGQSIGKRIYKIQLVKKSSQTPIGFGLAFLRGVLTSLPILSWIDFTLTVFTPGSQRYTDRLLGIELRHL